MRLKTAIPASEFIISNCLNEHKYLHPILLDECIYLIIKLRPKIH